MFSKKVLWILRISGLLICGGVLAAIRLFGGQSNQPFVERMFAPLTLLLGAGIAMGTFLIALSFSIPKENKTEETKNNHEGTHSP